SFLCIARLKSGVTVAQADQEMQAVAAAVRAANPDINPNMGAIVNSLEDFGMKDIRATLFMLLAAVGFVMLIACVNVANLLLARGAARQREFAVRRALGAAAGRIARQMITESLLLSAAGGLVGLALSAATTRIVFAAFQVGKLNLPLRP